MIPIFPHLLVLVPALCPAPGPLLKTPLPTITQDPGGQGTEDLGEELTGLASTLDCCAGKQIIPKKKKEEIWKWAADKKKWTIAPLRGRADGALFGNNKILIWPEIHGHNPTVPLADQPQVLGECARTLAHECLHFKCPPHTPPPPGAGIPPGDPDPDRPPKGEGRSRDCNDINYALHTAQVLCEEIKQIAESGGPVMGTDGFMVPNTDTPAGLCAYCEGLKKAYRAIQSRWNKPIHVDIATKCACGPDGAWNAGPAFPDCPTFSAPPQGCDGVPPYPGGKLVPDCEQTCPCDQ